MKDVGDLSLVFVHILCFCNAKQAPSLLWWAHTQPPAEQYPGGSEELSKQVKATTDRGS